MMQALVAALDWLGGRSRSQVSVRYNQSCARLGLFLGLSGGMASLQAASLLPVPELGVRIPPGFRIQVFAGPNLVEDVRSLTVDSRGDVVASGPGYIRTLLDEDNDGEADRALEFAGTFSGADDMCFAGPTLYFLGDGGLHIATDGDFDGVADGLPQLQRPLALGEEGVRGIARGPDGWFYLVGGRRSDLNAAFPASLTSAVRDPVAGNLLRFQIGANNAEFLATGFHNPRAVAFNAVGDFFVTDGDRPADVFLPWYASARVFTLAHGNQHGWRLKTDGADRPMSDYSPQVASPLVNLGRMVPSGTVSYRHYQFPEGYRNGLFQADWASGRIFFIPLEPNGSGYQSTPETFLEPIGRSGFAPSDLEVAQDGSLLIATGDRKMPGAIYRLSYDDPAYLINATNWFQTSVSDLIAVMVVPQRLSAWARRYWEPMANALGSEAFFRLLEDRGAAPELKLRAIEIITELFGGLDAATASVAAQSEWPEVRARVAWSLGRLPCSGCLPLLVILTRDESPLVRRHALDALLDRVTDADMASLQQAIAANLSHPDKQLRMSASRLATYLSEPAWDGLWARLQNGLPQARLTAVQALIWRRPETLVHTEAIRACLDIAAKSRNPSERLQVIRLIIEALGGYRLTNPSTPALAAYEPAHDLAPYLDIQARILEVMDPMLPSGNALVDFELARLLAMLEDEHPGLPARLTPNWTARSTPASDFHYLAVQARLKSPGLTNITESVANALLALAGKLGDNVLRPDQDWMTRLTEVADRLIAKDPGLAEILLRHPKLASPGNVALVPLLGADRRLPAARRFLQAAGRNAQFAWTTELVDLLASLPLQEVRADFLKQWNRGALRSRLVLKLAQEPEAQDRDKFLWALGATDREAIQAALNALLGLSPDATRKTLSAAVRLLRALTRDPEAQAVRQRALALISHESGLNLTIREQGLSLEQVRRVYDPVFDWFARTHPALYHQLDAPDRAQASVWDRTFKLVRWDEGNVARGERWYRQRDCRRCHNGTSHLGPDLGGLAGSLPPEDLFKEIVFPNRYAAEAFRAQVFTTRDRQTYRGAVAYESPESLILQPTPQTAVRLSFPEIQDRYRDQLSYMPAGLLDGLNPQDLADLYAYLKALPILTR